MAESKSMSILLLVIGVGLWCAWMYFWRYVNLAINKVLRGWLCKTPGSGCNKLFNIFRFIIVWGFNFNLVFAAIVLISGIFGVLTGRKPGWMKKTAGEDYKPKQQGKQQKKQQKKQPRKQQKKEGFLF